MENNPEHPTHVSEIVIIHRSSSLGQSKGELVSWTDEEMVSYATAHLLLVLVAIISALPAGVLIANTRKTINVPSAGPIRILRQTKMPIEHCC